MAVTSGWPAAQAVAREFVARGAARRPRQPAHWPVPNRVGDCSALFWWDDDHPVFEIPLFHNDDPAGFVVASGTEDLPPILQASPLGGTRSAAMNADVYGHLIRTGRTPLSIRWQYWSALEMVAEVQLADGCMLYLRYPEMFEVAAPTRIAIQRSPVDTWSEESVAARWEAMRTPYDQRSPESIGIILESREPIYYNQNCRAALRTATDPITYCSPNCISGCVPVAVAMLSGCWKKVEIAGSASRIWPGSSCWTNQWPSTTTSDPNRCAEVNTTIWRLHDDFRTTCGGGTAGATVATPTQNYYRNVWGLPWRFAIQNPVSFDQCNDIITRRHPFVFMAVGDFGVYLNKMAPDLAEGRMLGELGHAVACWGFDAAPWVGGPALLVGLGWGSYFESTWIEFDQFTFPHALYVSAFS
ncbi:MAG: hypothetical protein KDA58_10060 [Planctomycetaceae bacterium]|nr:hypothetical protein [Planctomycetaceae bacterium]